MNAARRRRDAEAGYALAAAILILFVITLFIAAIMVSNGSSKADNTRRVSDTRVQAVAERGIERYRSALTSGLAGWRNEFIPTTTQWSSIASDGEVVFSPDQLAQRPAFVAEGLDQTPLLPADRRVALRFPLDGDADGTDELFGWFQPLAILPAGPKPTGGVRPETTLYLRAWTTNSTERVVQHPQIFRVALRAQRFSDFQVLIDGPGQFLAGTTVDAPVHSNGYQDAYLLETSFNGTERIRALGADCQAGARFTTSSGTVTASGSCASTARDENTGRRINLLRARDTYQELNSYCGASTVVCLPGSVTRNVVLSGSTVSVDGVSHSALPWLAISSAGDIRVSGTLTNGYLTVAAGGIGSTFGGAKIILTGSGAIGSAGTNGASAVGLLAEGDLELDVNACPSSVRAAMVSTGGALTFPSQYRTWIVNGVPSSLPHCAGALSIEGSVASHYAPLTYLRFGTYFVGYQTRTWRYDKDLRSTPPPLWPQDETWSVARQATANRDCLQANEITKAACA